MKKIVMTISQRNKLAKEFFVKKCIGILDKKGRNYNPNGEAFAGFVNDGKELDISPEKVIWLMKRKHDNAVLSYIKGEPSSESIHERLADIANYAALLSVYYQTKEGKTKRR